MSDIEDVRAAEAERRRALLAQDRPALERLFADDIVHAHASGKIHDKAQIIDYVTKALHFQEITRGDLNIRVFGDIAIMTGDMDNLIAVPGQEQHVTLLTFATQVWRREPDGWKAISFHAVPRPKP